MILYLQILKTPEEKRDFKLIYDRYGGLMFYVANQILDNEYDSEDAVHQAFVSLADHMENIEEPICDKTKAFIVTIVERKAIDIYRQRKRMWAAPVEEMTVGITFELPNGAVANAIARLPTRYREFLMMKYVQGYENPELEKFYRLSSSGVRSLDMRAKNALKQLLEQEGIEV